MKKVLLFCVLACVAMMTGCGGSGSSGPSPFEGIWTGTWQLVGTAYEGTATVSIEEDGEFNATVINNATPPQSGTVEGVIQNNGHVIADLEFMSMSWSGTGTWELNEDGDIEGTLVSNDEEYTITFSLSPLSIG